VDLSLEPEAIGRCIDEVGIGFMFAQRHHPALKQVAPIRKELGFRTVFNLLGPLTNPAGAERQVMGVPSEGWLMPIAESLRELGCERAIVAHSRDGLDEFSTCAPTDAVELKDGELIPFELDPWDYHTGCQDPVALAGGTAEENAVIVQQVLHDGEGPSADIVCLNAAAILLVGGAAEDWPEAIQLARATIASGAARETLQRLREFTSYYAA
jgi:anthranilate phosphoribosyltransferase